MQSNLFKIPLFIKADSEEELQRKMLFNNAINQREYKYYEPIKEGDIYKVRFVEDVREWQNPDEVKDGR
jgi:hypothetical protein